MIAAALLACAVNVAPATMEAVIRVESGGNPLALNVNHLPGPQPHASTVTEAADLARRYIADGYTVDIGIAQINSRNLAALGYSVEDALDPCRGISGGAAILSADYARAVQQFGEGQKALQAALRAYNTGSFYRGDAYLARYYVSGTPDFRIAKVIPPAAPNPYTQSTLVFSAETINVRIE